MLAAQQGHAGAVVALLAANADINVKDKNGGTALMAAAVNGHEAAVNWLTS